MNHEETKCVIVVDESLPTGILANTAAILGISLGRLVPQSVGPDVEDASGRSHTGIITLPLPVLKGNRELLRVLREKLYTPDFADLTVVDFSDVAQGCHVYNDYIQKSKATQEADYTYLGIAVFGNRKKVNKLTGSLSLLR